MNIRIYVLAVIACLFLEQAMAQPVAQVQWPHGEKVAISLSYDDALNSQLDNVIPSLNKYNFKASFYLTLTSPSLRDRMEEWREIAKQGHELGNHSIYHPCRKSLPDRNWVAPHHDLDGMSVEQMREQLVTANTFLQAIDGKKERTFTIPCGDSLTCGENYLPAVDSLFVAIKNGGTQDGFSILWAANEVSGEELIDYVKKESGNHKLINILFHGVGGDYLSVSKKAHDKLLQYLANNKNKYWVDSYINIMKYVKRTVPAQ